LTGEVEQELKGLHQLSTATPVHDDNDEPIPAVAVLNAVSDLLSRRLLRTHLVTFLASLINCLSDPVAASARGASAVLAAMLASRGRELYGHVAELTEKLLWQLVAMADEGGCGETRVRALTGMRTLAALDVEHTCEVLLMLPVVASAQTSGLEETLTGVWRVMTQETKLASDVLIHLLSVLRVPQLYTETYSVAGKRVVRVARHAPVAAVHALDAMFHMKEMEHVCQGEFSSVFVPFLSALCSYLGIQASEELSSVKGHYSKVATSSSSQSTRDYRAADSQSLSSMSPFGASKSALSTFLRSKGCYSVARTVENQFSLAMSDQQDLTALSSAVCQLYDGVIHDGPQFLPCLATSLEPLLSTSEGCFGRRLTAVAFSVQLLRTEAPWVELSLRRSAVTNLLASLQREREIIEKGSGRQCEEDACTNSDSEEAQRTLQDARRTQANVLRRLALSGLASLQEDPGGGGDFLMPSVLSAFLGVLGDDPGGVSLAALTGLKQLLSADVVSHEDARRVLSEVLLLITF